MEEGSTPTSTGFDPVRLIETYQAGIWRFLRVLGCDTAQAEDLTQETFLAVLQKPFEDYNPAATGAYLRKVAYNRFITAQRRAGRERVVENLEDFDSAWAEWCREDNGEAMLDALRDCLTQLTDRARQALEMRFREKLARQEIAVALEITEHGAKNLMQRAKHQLRDCIDNKLQ